MKMIVDVITENNLRRPNYEGSFVMTQDFGDKMEIEVEEETDRIHMLEQTVDSIFTDILPSLFN